MGLWNTNLIVIEILIETIQFTIILSGFLGSLIFFFGSGRSWGGVLWATGTGAHSNYLAGRQTIADLKGNEVKIDDEGRREEGGLLTIEERQEIF